MTDTKTTDLRLFLWGVVHMFAKDKADAQALLVERYDRDVACVQLREVTGDVTLLRGADGQELTMPVQDWGRELGRCVLSEPDD